MTIRILCVGKLKERFYRDAVEEYRKRLSRYAKVYIAEVADEKTPDNPSEGEKEVVLTREGRRLEKQIREDDYVIGLFLDGDTLSSEEFAARLDEVAIRGKSNLVFVIGGSLGLSAEVRALCHETISFSAMTFPHQLMRVILLEQIYRAYRINRGEPYHK